MKKYVNGAYIEMTESEIAEMQAEVKENEYQERIRPRTLEESLIALNRSILTEKVSNSEDKTLGIESMALFETWTRGKLCCGRYSHKSKNWLPLRVHFRP